MLDLEIRQAPALHSEVVGHDAKPFRFDLAYPQVVGPNPWILNAVRKSREEKTIAMNVGPNQQHRSTYAVERNHFAFRS